MQGLLIAFPEKACELVPRPTTYLRHGPQDFRGTGLDAAAVRRDQETQFDLVIAEGDAEVPAENVPALQNLCVTVWLSHGTKDNTSNAARPGAHDIRSRFPIRPAPCRTNVS